MERKYALTKVAAGDYLLPSNDAKTLWRIARYLDTHEDHFKHFWGVYRWRGDLDAVDIEDWDRWEMVTGFLETRQDAIDEAMRLGR